MQERSLTWLWIPGVAIFAGSYALTVLNNEGDDATALIPVVGAFIAAGDSDGEFDSGRERFTLFGIGQLVGLAATIVGLTVTRKRFIREDLASTGVDLWLGGDARRTYGLSVRGTL